MSTEPRPAFPSGLQAIGLLLLLLFVESLTGTLMNAMAPTLGLATDAAEAITVLLSSGIVLAIACHISGIGYRQLLHPAPSSVASVAVLVVPPVLLAVPLLLLVLDPLLMGLEWLVPMSDWERAWFEELGSDTLPMLVMVCVLAPVLEEMLFRGVMLRGFLQRYPRWQAILGSAILFGVAHFNVYQFAVAFVLGTFSGWLYERCRSLVPCIALHAAFNAAGTFLPASTVDQGLADWVAAPSSWLLAALAAALSARWLWAVLVRSRAEPACAEETVF